MTMKKCMNCGKEINIISKDPNKVYYCKECSETFLRGKDYIEEEYNEKNKDIKKVFQLIFPGTYQFENKKYLKGIGYFFSSTILSLFWIISIYFEVKLEFVTEEIKGINYIMTVFILLNFVLIFSQNLLEITKGDD